MITVGEDIGFTVGDGLARVTFQSSDGLNGYTRTNLARLAQLVNQAASSEADIVLIDAVGENFCIGASAGLLVEMQQMPLPELEAFIDSGQDVIRAILDCDKPVVAHIDGFVAGGGVDLMLACDLAYVGPATQINFFYAKLGVLPDHGALFFLDERFGAGAGRREFLANKRRDAEHAIADGWASAKAPTAPASADWRKHVARTTSVPMSTLMALKQLRRIERGEAIKQHLAAIARVQSMLLQGQEQLHRVGRVAAMQMAKAARTELGANG
jgi:2-(1,2-epoxy-1,2-dihydrophenyl)acetyl-CoA isomerase